MERHRSPFTNFQRTSAVKVLAQPRRAVRRGRQLWDHSELLREETKLVGEKFLLQEEIFLGV